MEALLSIITLQFIVSYAVIKVNDQDRLSQNPPFVKTWADLLLSSRSNDDEKSLGLAGIKWVLNTLLKHFSVYVLFLDY